MKRLVQGWSILVLIMIFFVPINIIAQDNGEDVIIGKTIQLESKILNEKREIMVYLPPGYDQTNTKYPVLYLLDGRAHFQHAASTVQFLSRNGRMPQLIIVAVVNVDRTRDFTPTTTEERPQSGGFDKFIAYFQDELFPYIEKNYRTAPYRLLEGHSLGGMFSLHVLFNYPKMFQAHFAMSPYIMWDNNYVLNETMEKLQNPPTFQNFLYITLGDEENYVEPLEKFTTMLESKKIDGLEWHYNVMENDNHGTVPLKSLYEGLETLYKNWAIKAAVADQSVKVIEHHYQELSNIYGYIVEIPENTINVLGYRAMDQKKIDLALEFFLHNVTLYPESANVYDSLGEGYEAAGKLDLAKKNYEIAVKKGVESGNSNLAIYKEHLDKVTKKLSDNES